MYLCIAHTPFEGKKERKKTAVTSAIPCGLESRVGRQAGKAHLEEIIS